MWFGVVVLIVGILYLIGDLQIVKGWTALFVLAGIMLLFARK